jgi:multiple sugar transport system permease protein
MASLDIQNGVIQQKTKQRAKKSLENWWKKNGVGYLFLAPFMILFIIFTVIPVVVAFSLSLTNYNMLQPAKWAGLTNFKLLFMDDDVFLIALKNTLVFALITGPLGYIMSFIAAWVINGLKFKGGFALAFYAPSLTSSVAMSAVWLMIFAGDRYGYLNDILIRIGIMTEPIIWNKDPKYIMPVIIIISIWMSMGTGFLVFLAGLQNLPQELFEAGKIDGIKNKFQELWYIIFPLMQPQLLFGAVNSIVGSFGVFDIATSVAGMPSPDYAAHTIVAHLYDYAFIRFSMGYASAIAVVLFVMTFTMGRICMKVFKSRD